MLEARLGIQLEAEVGEFDRDLGRQLAQPDLIDYAEILIARAGGGPPCGGDRPWPAPAPRRSPPPGAAAGTTTTRRGTTRATRLRRPGRLPPSRAAPSR